MKVFRLLKNSQTYSMAYLNWLLMQLQLQMDNLLSQLQQQQLQPI